jgi:hypothetical protein
MRACVPPADATKASSTLRRRILASAPPIANKVPGISVTGGSHRRVAETCGQRSGRYLIARSAHCGSRSEAAYFVVVRRREACRLAPSQHGGARSAQRSQLTAEPRASPAFARTRRNSRARRSASKEEMLAPSSSKAASQAASNLAARWAVMR